MQPLPRGYVATWVFAWLALDVKLQVGEKNKIRFLMLIEMNQKLQSFDRAWRSLLASNCSYFVLALIMSHKQTLHLFLPGFDYDQSSDKLHLSHRFVNQKKITGLVFMLPWIFAHAESRGVIRIEISCIRLCSVRLFVCIRMDAWFFTSIVEMYESFITCVRSFK